MERRRQARIPLREQVLVTDLSNQAKVDPSEIIDYSGQGMAILVSQEVAINAAVRIDWQGAVLLGHVCYRDTAFDGRYRIGLQLSQVLSFDQNIEQLLQQLQAELAATAVVPLQA